ncbi:zinc finger protein 436-like [Protopterus annectens]|uniref:zinc finger protein 436-like n=1 Tax=Protopterus annectens TaxID=7888 RepID=UPI001CFADEC9|nr:zinc finger protein 436-like [Protopterus annectens]
MRNLCVTNGRTEQCCGEHRRRLELFCQEEETFICVLCVPRHSGHNFVFLHEAVIVYKDKLKASLSFLELKVKDLKDLQIKNETEFLEVQERAVNLEKYIAEEFVKLHQFLHDKEQKLIQQLNSKASEILKELEESREFIKTGVTEIHSAVSDTNLELKTEVEVLEERNDDTDCLATTEESVSGDTSEHGKRKANGVLSAPESFEDVAVKFSAEEMKMLTKQDKELHKEVMLENYETLVSAGYKIPPEALLVLLKEENAELPVDDMEEKNRTEHNNNFKENPNSNGSREWSICHSQQPSLGVSVSRYPTANLQHSVQTLKGSDRHPVIPVAQLHHGYTCNMNSECDPSSVVQQNPLVCQTAHKEKTYKCPECNKCFRLKRNLVIHERTHTEERPYKCPECNKCFRQRGDLVKHERTHMPEKLYKCAECNKGFTTTTTLRIHLSVHSGERPYKCPECNKCFRLRWDLVIHERTHTGERPYKCAECSKSFTTTSNLRSHLLVHKGEKPYKCFECNKCFVQKSNLVKHQKTHLEEKPYKCAECGKCYKEHSSFIYHKKIHRGEKPYKCAVCNKCFVISSVLMRHQSIHIGEKQYKCTKCGKCFTQQSRLTSHERVHTSDRPYKCTECSKCYRERSGLVYHQMSHKREKERNEHEPG